jgi:hypothetical protein
VRAVTVAFVAAVDLTINLPITVVSRALCSPDAVAIIVIDIIFL